MELAPGTVLAGRFEVEGPPLGAGQTGVVFPARDRVTGRPVAAKVLHPHRTGDRETLVRLQDEAGIAGRVRHPHVVEVLGLHSDGPGRWVLVTERVNGRPLSTLGSPLSPPAVVALGLQVADALAAVHRAGLVHGDLGPGSVLLTSRGAMLFDFAGARVAEADPTWLRPGETAPEVAAGGPPGVPADLYGLGLVLYRASTGALPFPGDTPWARVGAQRRGLARPPAGPRGLGRLITALLDPDPSRRPVDAAAVAAVLRALRKNPDRRVRVLRRPTAPFRPGAAWVVHGTDPATGGPAVIRGGLSRRAARALVGRLSEQGWQVSATREALVATDLVWVLVLGGLGGLVVPVLGAVPAGWLALRWRSGRTRPELRAALPAVRAPVPPWVAPAGTESALVAGLLMLATALLLVVWPWAAAVPGGLLVALGVWSLAARSAPEAASTARHGHVAAALADLRAALESPALSPDRALGLAGEVDALEEAWRAGALDPDAVLVRVDGLGAAVGEPGTVDPARAVLDALRRRDP